jgi:hypothetical protein
MKLARLALLGICLALAAPARGESDATAWKPAPPPRFRKAAIGLLVGGGACLVLGATFVGLAAKANNDALAGMKYHPDSDDARTNYQIADGVFFFTGGVAMVSGLVLLW